MTSTASAKVGANIRAEMARRGVTQAVVARQLGLSQAAVSHRLRGQVPVNVNELTTLAQYFEVSATVLLTGAAA